MATKEDAQVEAHAGQPLTAIADWFFGLMDDLFDCGDFALALHRITGWPVVELNGIHAGVRAPDGRLLDAAGWGDLASWHERYGLFQCQLQLVPPLGSCGLSAEYDEHGFSDELALAVSACRALPWPPFNDPAFAREPVLGADVPDWEFAGESGY